MTTKSKTVGAADPEISGLPPDPPIGTMRKIGGDGSGGFITCEARDSLGSLLENTSIPKQIELRDGVTYALVPVAE